jgi:hypothetical protein
MDLNTQKEQFSVAFVHAVASVAGVKVIRAEVDDDSIDVGLERTGGCAPKLDLQLKCTAEPIPNAGDISFALKMKNYEDLRRPTMAPRWLVVMFVPTVIPQWLEIPGPPNDMILRRCAWWKSLAGAPNIENTTNVTVHLPRQNLFTPEAIVARMDETEASFAPA